MIILGQFQYQSYFPSIFILNMDNKYIVCTTGFKSDDEEKYIQYLAKLGCSYVNQMKQQTNLLIVNCTATQKYKIAKLNFKKVQCVTANWIIQSKKANRKLPIDKYKVPSILYGVTVGILGFTGEQLNKIEKAVSDNGGSAVRITKQTFNKDTDLQCIISGEPTQDYYRIPQRVISEIPLVGLDWLELTLRKKICKFPKDYAYNYQLLKKNQQKSIEIQNFKLMNKLKNKLEQLEGGPLLNKQVEYLNDLIIYIDEGVDYTIRCLLKKIISARGGIYLNKFTSIVTHVLLGSVTHQNYQQHLKYGDVINLVRLEWLLDSIYLYRRMDEEDYQIKNIQNKQVFKQTLQNYKFYNSMPQHPVRINISVSSKNKKIKQGLKKQTQSDIFKKFQFLIQPAHKRIKQMLNIGMKIKQNGGNLYDSNNSQKVKHFYLVFSDSNDNKALLQKYKQFKEDVTPVSYRWINYCIAANSFIPHDKETYLTFRPFNIKTPNPLFLTYKIEILFVDQVLKRRLKQVLSILGVPSKSRNSELTHCLCKGEYQSLPKYKDIKNVNQNVKFVKQQWVLDTIGQGIILNISDYLLQ